MTHETITPDAPTDRFAPQEHKLRTRMHAAAENFPRSNAVGLGRRAGMADKIKHLSHLVEAMRHDIVSGFEVVGATPAQIHGIQLWITHGADLVSELTESEERS